MNSVSELTNQIKSLLEATFLHVKVYGEVSRPTYHSSGHLYFTLKDEKSSISCVMFKGNNQRLKFRVEESMAVHVSGSISLYAPRGSYQINCVNLEPSGSGALALAYEQLKKELSLNGYFDKKRPIPRFPKHITLVTSKTGAALQDMLKVAKNRFPLVKISLCDTLVQGEDAKYEIVKAIEKAQSLNPDIIIIGRGGGSVEDLWAFNEKEVAMAIFNSKIPTISAVGHAIDTLISDFVADATAPTPSAAMELALPDINELRITIDNLEERFKAIMTHKLENANTKLISLQNQLSFFSPKAKLKIINEEIATCKEAFKQVLNQKFHLFEQKLQTMQLVYENKNPEKLVQNGYAQLVKNGKIVTLDTLKSKDKFELQSTKNTITAQVLEIKG